MIRSQMSIGQTIASEKYEAVALCIFYRGLIGRMIQNVDQATYLLKLET